MRLAIEAAEKFEQLTTGPLEAKVAAEILTTHLTKIRAVKMTLEQVSKVPVVYAVGIERNWLDKWSNPDMGKRTCC